MNMSAQRTINDQQMATILAALRMFQKADKNYREEMPHFETAPALDDDGIDDLCEYLNCGSK